MVTKQAGGCCLDSDYYREVRSKLTDCLPTICQGKLEGRYYNTGAYVFWDSTRQRSFQCRPHGCGACLTVVQKVVPSCGHTNRMLCSRDPLAFDCPKKLEKKFVEYKIKYENETTQYYDTTLFGS